MSVIAQCLWSHCDHQHMIVFGHSLGYWDWAIKDYCGGKGWWGVFSFVVMIPTLMHLYFATCWDQIFGFRIERHMKYLYYQAPWKRSWWHHPEKHYLLLPIFGYFFWTAWLFELWYAITVSHGRRQTIKRIREFDQPIPLPFQARERGQSDQLEFDFTK